MQFYEFQATGRDVADLGAIPEIAAQGFEDAKQGRVYFDGTLFIETLAVDTFRPEYQLTIGNDSSISADLANLERRLYAFAVSEGYIDGGEQS